MPIEQPTNETNKAWEEQRFLDSVERLVRRFPESEDFIRTLAIVIRAKNRPNPDEVELAAA